jgi:Putative translation initiation inhibitor, yjgF family
MKLNIINPWQWQEHFGYVQGVEVSGSQQTLYCAGQAAVNDDGSPLQKDDMPGQIKLALDNLEQVLKKAGYDWPNVVRLNIYTTDLDKFFSDYEIVMTRLASTGCKPSMTLLGVTRLAFPELLVEIEATAVK